MMYGGEGQGWPDKSYTYVDSGLYNEPSEDFSQQIGLFKKEGCEILQGVMIDPDWTVLTKQCAQQGYKPKIMEGSSPPSSQPRWAIGPCGWSVYAGLVPPDLPVQVVSNGRDRPEMRRLREDQEHAVAADHHALRRLQLAVDVFNARRTSTIRRSSSPGAGDE
jgi:hypothetical protein